MTASTFARHAQPTHKAVARMVGYTLALTRLDGLRAYWGLARVLRAKLTPSERQGLAWAALMACDDDEAEGIADAVLELPQEAGTPLPPLSDVVDDAAWWARIALPEERRAYALAAFYALDLGEQGDFLAVAHRKVAA